MPALQIQLNNALHARVESRAAESGYSSAQAYVESLLKADTGIESAPDADLENLLLRRISSGPTFELTLGFMRKFKKDLAQRRKPPANRSGK